MKINKVYFKCPVCQKMREFKQMHISCTREYLYLDGDYVWLYRCEKCHIIIAKGEKLKWKQLKNY